MKKLLFVFAIMASLVAEAQIATPAPSPAASVSSVVGLTNVKIDYSRPRARGRKIFGTGPGFLVPYGSLWRTGANNGTKISFSDDVTVEGQKVPKGEYLIFSWPGATEWTISLYKDLAIGGNTGDYKKENELLTFKVKSEQLTKAFDTFTINIDDIAADNKTAKVSIAWETTLVRFSIGVDFDARVMQSIEASTKVSPDNYYAAAIYYFETGKDLKQAMEFMNKANPTQFFQLYQKARLQKAMGDNAGAMATSKLSFEESKKANNADYQKLNEELQKTLK